MFTKTKCTSMKARYKSNCVVCAKPIFPGDLMTKGDKGSFHKDCGDKETVAAVQVKQVRPDVDAMIEKAREEARIKDEEYYAIILAERQRLQGLEKNLIKQEEVDLSDIPF